MSRIDSLEPRRLLAATVSFSSKGTMIITGTSAAENIVVDAAARGYRVTDGDAVIYDTTATGGRQARRVEINAAGGDDRITVTDNVRHPLTVNGGAGDDVIGVTSDSATLSGGAGNDKLVATPGAAQPTLTITGPRRTANRYFGGAGDDVIVSAAANEIADGGLGTDVLYLNAPDLNASAATEQTLTLPDDDGDGRVTFKLGRYAVVRLGEASQSFSSALADSTWVTVVVSDLDDDGLASITYLDPGVPNAVFASGIEGFVDLA